MGYSEKVIEHYNNPRNVGSLPKEDPNVGTGLVGAPECGDVMKLQIEITYRHQCQSCQNSWDAPSQEPACRQCASAMINVQEIIVDSKFKTFGCGSAIASSSLATEWIKGKTLAEALAIKNTDIVKELSLPPVKIHCSVLAEDAIKSAIKDWKAKQEKKE
ncbi:MAG: iron-sulfur cluster assembly scaffold protein [Patescibacteria group bacterium]